MVRIGYPLADRGERLRAGHERCDGDREDSRQAVSDPRRLRGSGTVANSSKALTRTARADGLQAAGEVREDVIDGGPWLGGWLRHRHPSPKDHTGHTGHVGQRSRNAEVDAQSVDNAEALPGRLPEDPRVGGFGSGARLKCLRLSLCDEALMLLQTM
jgi:hypothetical protein